MNQTQIATLRSYFAKQPVEKAWLFGSVARGETRDDSDVDILVVFDKNANVGLFEHVGMAGELRALLGKEVDLVTEGSLLPWVRASVENDRQLIYERETA